MVDVYGDQGTDFHSFFLTFALNYFITVLFKSHLVLRKDWLVLDPLLVGPWRKCCLDVLPAEG